MESDFAALFYTVVNILCPLILDGNFFATPIISDVTKHLF